MKRRELLGMAGAAGLVLAGCSTPGLHTQAGVPPMPNAVSRIGFGSCADQSKPQPIWDTVLADGPHLFLFGGDNVYSSMQPWSMEKLQEAYRQEDAEPHFARFRRAIPYLAIWDDNDYGLNDGGAEFRFKGESKAAFLNFWRAAPNDPRRSRDGLYDARVFGPAGRRVQVIMLDTRWFRSAWKPTDQRNAAGKERFLPDSDPAKSMLGEVQWRWLEEQLRQEADVRLIVSGIQVIVDGHGWERWGNFPLELQRLYRTIAATRAQGVVLLSGDRHFGAIYRETRGAPYPLYELTSSGITHTWRDAAEAGPNRIGDPFTELHYAMVDIDWTARSIRLALKDIAGVARRTQVISLDPLRIHS
ncbi:MAG TPA: alkaline phosphatase D family protein [Ramlibacter sp.]|nr:alkaline phosphatase D family protein [Ramlibacter sp.]